MSNMRCRVVFAEHPEIGILGVKVSVTLAIPGDRRSKTGVTDSTGRASLAIAPTALRPGAFVLFEIFDKKGEPLVSERFDRSVPRLEVTFRVSVDKAIQAGFIRRQPAPASGDPLTKRVDGWAKKTKDPKSKVPLCLTKAILDMVAGVDNPKTELQKQLAKVAAKSGALKDKHTLAEVLKATKRAQTAMNGMPGMPDCGGGSTPHEIVKTLYSPGGAMNRLAQAVMEQELEPSPKDIFTGSGRAGWPFVERRKPSDQCNNAAPKDFVKPPIVNHIDIFMPLKKADDGKILGKTIREADPHTKIDRCTTFDRDSGWTSFSLEFDRPFTDAECLVNLPDAPGTARQALVVDIGKGLTLVCSGASFVCEEVQIHVRKASFQTNAEGRIVLDGAVDLPGGGISVDNCFHDVPGWESDVNTARIARVYGSPTPHGPNDKYKSFTGDVFFFEWPDLLARPGIYELSFEVENKTDPHIGSGWEISQPDCTWTEVITRLISPPIYLAVLEMPARRMLDSLTIDRVKCIDEKGPEAVEWMWFDDILLTASASIAHFSDDPNRVPTAFTADPLENYFPWDGTVWDPGLNVMSGSLSEADRTIGYLDFVSLNGTAFEIFGAMDHLALKLALWLIWLAVLIIIALAIVAVVAGLLVALVYFEVITAATATALAGPIFSFLGDVVGPIYLQVGQAGFDAIGATVDGMPDFRTAMCQADIAITGLELALGDGSGVPSKWGKKLFKFYAAPTPSATPSSPMSASFSPQSLVGVFTSAESDFSYEITARVQHHAVMA